jgi:hypothetical protein
MERPSFTIEFPEHVKSEKSQYVLNELKSAGAEVEQHSDRTYLITCSKANHLNHIGWALFHSHFREVCRVIAVSGGAEARASAYSRPPKSDSV